MVYFAYGSNMSMRRIRSRIPSAQLIGIGQILEHKLVFHKVGRTDGSAKCNADFTGDVDHFVFGVLYRIDPREKLDLDREEGLGNGYEEKKVKVVIDDGERVEAFTYYATRVDASLRPYSWYKYHVVMGARENGLPPEYVSIIESVGSISDPDSERERRELGIYR